MTDMAEEYRALPHSDLALPPSAERMDENDRSKPLTVIVTLRPAPGSQPDPDDDAPPSMAKLEDFMPLDALVRQYGASSEGVREVEEFADRFGLKPGSFNVTVADKPEAIETGGRIILLSGTVAAFETAFGPNCSGAGTKAVIGFFADEGLCSCRNPWPKSSKGCSGSTSGPWASPL